MTNDILTAAIKKVIAENKAATEAEKKALRLYADVKPSEVG